MNIKNTQKDFQGASSPELATSSLTWLVAWLVMKLLRFVAEAKKLSNHHRTPISSSMFGPGGRDLTSLKWPTAHKSLFRHSMKKLRKGFFRGPAHGFSHWSRSEREGNSGSSAFLSNLSLECK
ncbi:uncharacterized protein METZ01_LOCUS170637 [marine metagenome]|uniref:Uncharacterized protein n=1 Tax=marine metagenome TaxID=408172 RepID=A0A382BXJ0_9ZZZZ